MHFQGFDKYHGIKEALLETDTFQAVGDCGVVRVHHAVRFVHGFSCDVVTNDNTGTSVLLTEHKKDTYHLEVLSSDASDSLF